MDVREDEAVDDDWVVKVSYFTCILTYLFHISQLLDDTLPHLHALFSVLIPQFLNITQ